MKALSWLLDKMFNGVEKIMTLGLKLKATRPLILAVIDSGLDFFQKCF